jgi:pimeloyl-ACP methyl ester carboxylesterase
VTGPVSATTADQVGANFKERSVIVDGLAIRYYQAGEGDPLIVLHGAGGLRFSRALDLLAQDRLVVCVEMPGWGKQSDYHCETLEQLATTVAAAVAAIGIDRYDLLGTSLGGAVATQLALDYPERVRSLVLAAPATFRVGATLMAPGASPETMLRRFRVHPERTPAFELPNPEAVAQRWPMINRLLASRPEYDDEVAARLPSCHVPTLVVFGDRDGIVPAENGRTFRRLMPNCTYLLIHDAAHDIQGDRPEAFAETVSDFLRRGILFLIPETSTRINP